ncbi:DUF2798 domain-containing protein [Chryseobacterium sp. 22532]|uniref:DUF2798 domain-containing protein n=1 Tax=Chryseobacterium sp. 22532 TaxID=3453938 RepID=UPI003F85C7C4
MLKLLLKNLIVTGIITFILSLINRGDHNIIILNWLRSWFVAWIISLFFNVILFSNYKK